MRCPELRTARLLVCALVGVCAVSMWGGTSRCQQPKNTYSYPDGSKLVRSRAPDFLNGEAVRIGDGCVGFDGDLIGPGGFFHDLKRRNTAYGPVFRVGHTTVTDFPDEVVLDVVLRSGVACSKGAVPRGAAPSLDPLKSLRAEAAYVRDLRMEPLEINLREIVTPNFPIPPPVRKRLWIYRFEVKTKGVRLTDALVISLFSEEGKKVAQLSWGQ